MSPTLTPSPAPSSPFLSPQAFKVLALGATVFVLLVLGDVALEVTGHGSAAVATVILKVLEAGVSLATMVFMGKSPSPQQAAMASRLAFLEKHATSTPPAPHDTHV
jgi:hypothetical protein